MRRNRLRDPIQEGGRFQPLHNPIPNQIPTPQRLHISKSTKDLDRTDLPHPPPPLPQLLKRALLRADPHQPDPLPHKRHIHMQEALLIELRQTDRQPTLVVDLSERGRGSDEVEEEMEVRWVDGVFLGSEEGQRVQLGTTEEEGVEETLE